MFTKARVWLQSKWAWAKRNPLFWAYAALVCLTAFFLFACPVPRISDKPSDIVLRVWAMVLQLLGAYTVWYDLTRSARSRGKKGFLAEAFEWLKQFAGKDAVAQGGIGTATAPAGFSGRAFTRNPMSADQPVEARLSALEHNVAEIDKDLANALSAIDGAVRRFDQELRDEAQQRDAATRDLENQLNESIVGNYSVLVFGAVWAALGIALSTFSPELFQLQLR